MLQIQITSFFFKQTITNEEDFTQITMLPGAYEIENLNKDIKIIIDNCLFTENEYPLTNIIRCG